MKLRPFESNPPDQKLITINLPEEISRLWVNSNELKGVNVRNFLKVIRRSVQFLSYQYQVKQIDICRVAVHLGVKFLYGLPGIMTIKECRHHMLQHSIDLDDIRLLENRFFDFKSNETERFFGRFPEEDINQCNGLADILGLNKAIVLQIAIIYPLLYADIPVLAYNQMGEIFIRFRKDLESWAQRALKLKNECRKNDDNICKIPLEDIIGTS